MHRLLILASAMALQMATAQEMMEEETSVEIVEEDVLVIDRAQASMSASLPRNGIDKTDVVRQFGEPVDRVPAVGQPPISRWIYQGFVVYFEYDLVLHSVLIGPQGA